MNTHRIVSISALVVLLVLSLHAPADDFPAAYIQKGLVEAQKTVSVDTSHIAEGGLLTVTYIGRPVYIYRRTAADIAALESKTGPDLADPDSKDLARSIRHEYGSSSSTVWARLLLLAQPIAQKTPFRSLDKKLLVIAGWSPESGCVLTLMNDPQKRSSPTEIFSDTCTGAKFDAAGRVFKGFLQSNRFALNNIAIPPYQIAPDGKLTIGPAGGQQLPELNYPLRDLYQNLDATRLLITAASFNDIDTVRAALGKGANAAFYRTRERSPIDAAVIGSSMEIVQLLVAHGARPTPNTLALAKLVDRPEVIELLTPLNGRFKKK